MENVSRVKHYANREAYLNKTSTDAAKKSVKAATESATKVDLSDKSVDKSKKDLKKDIKETVKKDLKEVKGAGRHLLGDAIGAVVKNIPNPLTSIVPLPSVKIGGGSSATTETSEIPDRVETKPVNKPGVFFVSGLKLASSSGGDGLKDMADAVRGAEHYSWKDEDKVLEEILKRPKTQPIVLVGHSLGGDAIVNIANRLNSLEHGFRKVDLLTTLDSVGFNNDIIPSNVEKNLNFISDDDYFFNDGPNIARNVNKTEVTNVLRGETHRAIDDQTDVQSEIISHVDEVIGGFKLKRRMEQMKDLYESFAKKDSNS